MLLRILVICAVNAFTNCAAQGFEFKGVPFGSTPQQLQSRHNHFECYPGATDPSVTVCELGLELCKRSRVGCAPSDFDASTYAGETVDRITAFFLDGTFERLDVAFKPQSYEAVKEALSAKLGRAVGSTQDAVVTTTGTKATNETTLWSGQGAQFLLKRYDGTLSQGGLSVMSTRYGTAMTERQPQKAKARQKNM